MQKSPSGGYSYLLASFMPSGGESEGAAISSLKQQLAVAKLMIKILASHGISQNTNADQKLADAWDVATAMLPVKPTKCDDGS